MEDAKISSYTTYTTHINAPSISSKRPPPPPLCSQSVRRHHNLLSPPDRCPPARSYSAHKVFTTFASNFKPDKCAQKSVQTGCLSLKLGCINKTGFSSIRIHHCFEMKTRHSVYCLLLCRSDLSRNLQVFIVLVHEISHVQGPQEIAVLHDACMSKVLDI